MSWAERSFAWADGQFGLCLSVPPLGVVVLGPGRVAIGEKFALALLLRPALLNECLCRRKIGLGGFQGVLLVLAVQAREQVALGNLVPDVHEALDDLAPDAEPQTAFMACPDFAGQGGRPVELRHLHPQSADERRLGGRRRRLLASQKHEADDDRRSRRPWHGIEILHGTNSADRLSAGAAF